MTSDSIKIGINEKVIVFGGNGFIGKAISEYLRNESINYFSPKKNNCDLLNLNQVQAYLNQFINQRIHIVFCAAINRRIDDSWQSMQHNIQIVSNFIKGSQLLSLASFIFLSTIDVYKKPYEKPITENTPIDPIGYYAISKVYSENLIKNAWPQLPTLILRLPGIYGKGDGGSSIISNFAQKIQEGSTLKLSSVKQSPMRDYVNILDLCKIIHHFLYRPHTGTYNVATGKSLMITEIVQLIEKALKLNAKINFIKAKDDSDDIFISNRKIRKLIPNFRFTSMEAGINNYK
jgi:UDP-glucose 4-epimerase